MPFDLHTHGSSGFIVFETHESVGLPLMSLGKATLRGESGRQIVLEFADSQVVVEGEGLQNLFSHILLGRAKTIRPGTTTGCTVANIHILDI